MFCSNYENYILEYEAEAYNQNSLGWLDGMNVLKVFKQDNSFFVLYCEDFDSEIWGRHVHRDGTDTRIERNIEPNTVSVLDMTFVDNPDQADLGNFWMAMLQDQKFIIDRFPCKDYQREHMNRDEDEFTESKSWEIDLSEGFSSSWPFVTYKGMPSYAAGGYG
jgi:hypothetical protein